MLVVEKAVSNSVSDYFNSFFDDKSLFSETDTCTVNGKQSSNICKIIDNAFLGEIKKHTTDYINNYYGSNLDFYSFLIDHLHLINYNSGGHQLIHTHCQMEDHSFILYLNDSDGATRLYLDGTYVDILPQKNKIVFFNAACFHEGLKSSNEKRVLVGSITFLHKVWKQRV